MAGRARRAAAECPAGMTGAPRYPHAMCRTVPGSILDQITPLILTCNELPNIERTLAKLAWAKRIVVIDSGRVMELGFQIPRIPRRVTGRPRHANPFVSASHGNTGPKVSLRRSAYSKAASRISQS